MLITSYSRMSAAEKLKIVDDLTRATLSLTLRCVRSQHDMVGMLKVQAARLNYGYLNDGARELALTDLLVQAYEDAGIEPG